MDGIIEYFENQGRKVIPKKSFFQENQEIATMLLTFMMSENDFLRQRMEGLEQRIEALEASINE